MTGRQFRSKLELLRDFLSAAHTETIKTRIRNRASLNQVSFSRYMNLCEPRQLLAHVDGGYSLRPEAAEMLESISIVLSRATNLPIAVDGLSRTARSGGYRLPHPEILDRGFDRIDFPEFLSPLPITALPPHPLRQE